MCLQWTLEMTINETDNLWLPIQKNTLCDRLSIVVIKLPQQDRILLSPKTTHGFVNKPLMIFQKAATWMESRQSVGPL